MEVSAREGFFSGTVASMREIWSRRELLGLLTRRELVSRYKDSSLGVVWSLIRPLAQLLIYYFAIGVVLQAQRSIPDFAIFVFIGLTMWTLYADVITIATTAITGNAGIVKKVRLPYEVFPLSSIGSALFNFGAQVIVLFLALIAFGRLPTTPAVALAPLALLVMLVFASALGLLVAALNVYFRDVQHIVEVALVVLFWLSPIVYSYTFVHRALGGSWLEQLYLANPATVAIVGMQQALWVAGSTATGDLTQTFPDHLGIRLLVMLAVCLVLLWLAQRVFRRLSRNFAQEL